MPERTISVSSIDVLFQDLLMYFPGGAMCRRIGEPNNRALLGVGEECVCGKITEGRVSHYEQ